MRTSILLAVAVVGAIIALLAWRDGGTPSQAEVATVASSPAASENAAAEPAAALARGEQPSLAPAVDPELVAALRDEYGAHIGHASMQMRMIEALMRYFQQRFPDAWREHLLAAVRAAFPDHYDEIVALLDARLEYEMWVEDSRDSMSALSREDKREAVRAAREQMFGRERAEALWASQYKSQALGDALSAIDTQQGASIGDRLDMYRDSLEDVYGDDVDGFLERHRHQAMSRFFDMNSVQRELAAMPAEERRAQMREVRAGMGLDDDALSRWDQLDEQRDERWSAGAQYMDERAQLAAELSGDALEARVHELRVEYFGELAETLRSEEQSGYFRFDDERVYGRN
ncbi:lipase secretion chaperone [Haliangium ochraceum]|uniref:Lipase helper protein n=1 Tax=Haliangium ochraceum (strain DSM 14365 / JCM 11303 / SMP-2) TaxID=502025 RepID=D0LT02_HALO1|nr:lipase secretion chaperone [Haliangium ochraceum]ACY19138.1 conserved hypothetical protein [Haliangium ochraceum DSM 14365]